MFILHPTYPAYFINKCDQFVSPSLASSLIKHMLNFIHVDGSGGRDLSGNKRTNKDQSFDQTFEKMNKSLQVSCLKGYPVRVVR